MTACFVAVLVPVVRVGEPRLVAGVPGDVGAKKSWRKMVKMAAAMIECGLGRRRRSSFNALRRS